MKARVQGDVRRDGEEDRGEKGFWTRVQREKKARVQGDVRRDGEEDRGEKGFWTRVQREKESEGISEKIGRGEGAGREMSQAVFECQVKRESFSIEAGAMDVFNFFLF